MKKSRKNNLKKTMRKKIIKSKYKTSKISKKNLNKKKTLRKCLEKPKPYVNKKNFKKTLHKKLKKSKYYTRKNKKGGQWWRFTSNKEVPWTPEQGWAGPVSDAQLSDNWTRPGIASSMTPKQKEKAFEEQNEAIYFDYSKLHILNEVEKIESTLNNLVKQILEKQTSDGQQSQVYEKFIDAAQKIRENAGLNQQRKWKLKVKDLMQFIKAAIPVAIMLGNKDNDYDKERNELINKILKEKNISKLFESDVEVITPTAANDILSNVKDIFGIEDIERQYDDQEKRRKLADHIKKNLVDRKPYLPIVLPDYKDDPTKNIKSWKQRQLARLTNNKLSIKPVSKLPKADEANLIDAFSDPAIAGLSLMPGRHTRSKYYPEAHGSQEFSRQGY